MSDRKHCERLRHLRVAGGEKPRDDRAPIVTRDMGRRTPKGFDERGHVIDQVIEGVALLGLGSIGEAIAAKVGGDRKASGFRKRIHLARPRLGPFWKSVQEDEHVGLRRAVDHGPEPKAVRLHHVLARGHLICLMKTGTARSAPPRGRSTAIASMPRCLKPTTYGFIEAALPDAPWPRTTRIESSSRSSSVELCDPSLFQPLARNLDLDDQQHRNNRSILPLGSPRR